MNLTTALNSVPEERALEENPDDLEEHDAPEAEEHLVRLGDDVRVPELVDLDEGERGREVHEGGVELKVLVGGADVVAGGEDALEHDADAHGVEDPKVLRQAVPKVGSRVVPIRVEP